MIHQCLLTFGHYGWTMDLPHQQRLRDVMGLEIGDGTAQVMKLIVRARRSAGWPSSTSRAGTVRKGHELGSSSAQRAILVCRCRDRSSMPLSTVPEAGTPTGRVSRTGMPLSQGNGTFP